MASTCACQCVCVNVKCCVRVLGHTVGEGSQMLMLCRAGSCGDFEAMGIRVN